MLYRQTITEEYTYETESERTAHVALKVSEGFVDSGQLKERIRPAVLLSGLPYPVWDNAPEDYTWYAKLTKVDAPGASTTTPETLHGEVRELRTNNFGMSDNERKLRRLHDLALIGVGDSQEGRALANECYLALLSIVT